MSSRRNKPHAKQRTYARNRQYSRRGNSKDSETDGSYLLKLVLVFLLGTFWLKFSVPIQLGNWVFSGFPLGFFVGLLLVSRFEHFQTDRKIWYAILIITAMVSYFLPAGIVI